jgi:hypothetical protein
VKKPRAKVLAQTEFGTYGDYDWSGEYKKLVKEGKATQPNEPIVAREGDYPNGVILIRAGSVASPNNTAR